VKNELKEKKVKNEQQKVVKNQAKEDQSLQNNHSMIIRLTGSSENTSSLYERVNQSLENLGLLATVDVEIFDDEAYKKELKIQEDPALCIEEESIDFKDMIFE